MKTNYYITLIITFLVSCNTFGQEPAQKMKEAADLYQKGNFFEAATIYKSLYDQGYRSVNLAFNAGNAWYKAKDYGYAVLFYERARLLDPAGEDVNYNLQMARSHNTDKFDDAPELFFVRWFDFLSLLAGTNQWAFYALVLFIITLVLAMFFLFSQSQSLRTKSFWFAIVTLVLSLFSLLFSVRSNNLVNHNKNSIVVCNETVGKSSPGSEGKDLFVIHSGTKVRIIQKMGEYSEIRLPDGNKGWTRNNCIENL